jgi:CheY-like chemotaxis protein
MDPTNRACILVVEDDAAVRDALRDVLRDAGYAVMVAEDGAVALGAIDGQPIGPDAVLLDLNMPHMDGSSFLQCLRSRPESRRTPVIVVTGAARPTIPGGYSDVRLVRKPFDVNRLLALVQVMIANQPRPRN